MKYIIVENGACVWLYENRTPPGEHPLAPRYEMVATGALPDIAKMCEQLNAPTAPNQDRLRGPSGGNDFDEFRVEFSSSREGKLFTSTSRDATVVLKGITRYIETELP